MSRNLKRVPARGNLLRPTAGFIAIAVAFAMLYDTDAFWALIIIALLAIIAITDMPRHGRSLPDSSANPAHLPENTTSPDSEIPPQGWGPIPDIERVSLEAPYTHLFNQPKNK